MVGTLVRAGRFLVRSGRLRSGHGTKCLETYCHDCSENTATSPRRKQDDPYPLPTRTQHFCQPVPYTNPYPIPARTIYLTHVMRGSAAASGQAARARAAGVSTRDQRWSVRLQATDTPVP